MKVRNIFTEKFSKLKLKDFSKSLLSEFLFQFLNSMNKRLKLEKQIYDPAML